MADTAQQTSQEQARGEETLPVEFIKNIPPGGQVGSLYRKVLGKPEPEELASEGCRGLYGW